MVVIHVVKAAASVAIGVLTLGTLNNVCETFLVVQTNSIFKSYPNLNGNDDDPTHRILIDEICCKSSSKEVLSKLQKLKRSELLELFIQCSDSQPIPETEMRVMMKGEWDGILLNNNFVMVRKRIFTFNNLVYIN